MEDKQLKRKQGSKFSIEYWKKHYPNESLEELQKRLEEFRRPLLNKRGFSNTLKYWIDKGYNEEEAKIKLKERQSTFTLKKCISKYGEELGRQKWQERQDKWQNTLNSKSEEEIKRSNKSKGLTKEKYIEKHGEEAYLIKLNKKWSVKRYIEKYGEDAYKELLEKKRDKIQKINYYNPTSQSKTSLKMFDMIIPHLNGKEVFYNKNEKCIRNKEKGFYYKVDFFCNNKIIEFFGDYYHANPIRFKNETLKIRNTIYKTEDIRKSDNIRINNIINEGYSVLVIWEYDFINNQEETIKKCIDFILS